MKKENTGQESVLGDMKPSRAITRLAVPATLALLAKAVYNIVDTAYIGMLGSDIALAAVGVTFGGKYFCGRRSGSGRQTAGSRP